MHLRHLIVLIIDARNSSSPSCKAAVCRQARTKFTTPSRRGVLIGQIKLTRIHVASSFLPGVRVKRNGEPSLYDVERSGSADHESDRAAKLALCVRR